jgi:hypothetical protein
MLALDELEHHYLTGHHADASMSFDEFVEQAPTLGPLAILELVRRINHPHHGFAVCLALAGGELSSRGQPSSLLGRALITPLMRALVDARRMLDHVAHLPDAKKAELQHNEDAFGRKQLRIGSKLIDNTVLEAIGERDLAALQAWEALDVWHVPIVATWARDIAILRDMQQSAPFRKLVNELGDATATTHALSILLETLFGARFVLLLPELEQAYSFVADGVVNMGQLCALLTPHLREPLAELGVTKMPDTDIVATMRGQGPQWLEAWYRCAFHCYPVDLSASRGLYDAVRLGSLGPDFLPAKLPRFGGTRVVLLLGPRSSIDRFERCIPAGRMFEPLRADVAEVTRLDPAHAKRWFDLVGSRAGNQN